MSKVLFDACSVINLSKAGVLGHVLALDRHEFSIGNEVLDECDGRCEVLNEAVGSGRVTLLDDSTIPVSRYVDLLRIHRLGEGETECLVYAELEPQFIICSDDRAARNVAIALYGADRVIGSIGLLRHCIETGSLSEDQAFFFYEEMRKHGGFLPVLSKAQFLIE